MNHLIQILLPVERQDINRSYEDLARELTGRFGGVTSFIRAPAEGRWNSGNETELDDIAVLKL